MERVLQGLEPERVFYFFEEMCRIPHGSGNEQALSDWMVDFAKQRGLRVIQDKVNNVIIYKPATAGNEHKKAVMLQAHMDMVAVKVAGSDIDLAKDPLDIYVEGDKIKARGTSLGGDDGAGCAMALALLDSDDIPHPALQCIFTTNEEVGMYGAADLDPNLFESEYLVNLDGGDDKTHLTVSCAGSSTNVFTIKKNPHVIENKGEKAAYEISIGGITSGHSAMMASFYGANSIMLLGEYLADIFAEFPAELCCLGGGTKMNAIAKESFAKLVIEKKNAAAFEQFTLKLAEGFVKEYLATDPDIFIKVTPCEMPEKAMDETAAKNFVKLTDLVPNWAFKYFAPDKLATKVSSNAGILTDDGEVIELTCMLRSNSDLYHEEYIRKMVTLAELLGIGHRIEGKSMAWEYEPDAVLPKIYSDLIEKETGKRPVPVMTHGGVEPGTIIALAKSVGKSLSAIVMGSRGEGIHSVDEALFISSVGPAYDWLIKVINSLD
ncbi:MAG: aminoacyl-histidine dipeptidase [Eubacteriaceae bacterium]|nr:aminoacyl-histidine dipeptidase [Eubacteriaceae bacterium]